MTEHLTGVAGLNILVVGASGAIGGAIADGLLDRGANVVRTTRDPGAARDPGTVVLDVADESSVAAGVEAAARSLGRLDAVVNASGVTRQTPTVELDLASWQEILQINLAGSFLLSRAAARVMLDQSREPHGRGSIVLIASLCAQVGCDQVAAYSASKAGVLGFARSLASELGPEGVRVNTITPGVFPTALNRARIEGRPRGNNSLVRTPLGRFGDPEELVGAAAYLCGRDASFVTGTDLVVDGGFLSAGITERTVPGA